LLWTPPDGPLVIPPQFRDAHAIAVPPDWGMTPADYLRRLTAATRSSPGGPQHRKDGPTNDDSAFVTLAWVGGIVVAAFGMILGISWASIAIGTGPLVKWLLTAVQRDDSRAIEAPDDHPPLEAIRVLPDKTGLSPQTLIDIEAVRALLPKADAETHRKWWEVVTRGCGERDAHLAREDQLRARNQPPIATTRRIVAPPLSWSPPESQRPTPPPPAPTGSTAMWELARSRHERVIEAWTAMVTDPLAALSHSSLFDTTNTWTAAFIGIYGQASDFIAVHGTEPPHDRTLIDSYAALTREVESAWQSALIRAERSDLDWLPPAERADADRARRLLTLASDEAASLAERANAAQKAADLLRKVHSFVLPATTLTAIEAGTRPPLG
jgi:hypothetical protein